MDISGAISYLGLAGGQACDRLADSLRRRAGGGEDGEPSVTSEVADVVDEVGDVVEVSAESASEAVGRTMLGRLQILPGNERSVLERSDTGLSDVSQLFGEAISRSTIISPAASITYEFVSGLF